MFVILLSQQTLPVSALHQEREKAQIQKSCSAQHLDKRCNPCRAAQLRPMLCKHWLRLRPCTVQLHWRCQFLIKVLDRLF